MHTQILFLTLTLLVSFICNKSLPKSQREILILISFDGFRWDYLENNSLPIIHENFVEQGSKVSHGLINAFSTVTFPNHWTLATGLYPESHGIVSNVMYDSTMNDTFIDFQSNDNSTKWFGQNKEAIPIWILNQLDGKKKSAIVGRFPGANVPIMNKTVSYSADYANQMGWYQRVDTLIEWMISDENNNFGVLYFDEPDDVGHEFGPYSQEIKKILKKIDMLVGYLIARLKELNLYDSANIIITSDHGMDIAMLNQSIDLSQHVNISKFNSYGGLTQINIFPKNDSDENLIYDSLKKIPHYNIFRRNQVLERLNYRNNIRIGKLVMYGDVGYEIIKSNREKFDWSKWKGDHGSDNSVESMHPVFVARGPAFKKNYTTNSLKIHSVDVYSLMCFLLNLKPAENNGTFDNIKNLIDENYYDERIKQWITFNLIKSIFYSSFKYESITADFKLIANLNRNGNLYVVFLIFLLIIFILVIQSLFKSRKIFISISSPIVYRLDEEI